uniref:Secreted protein n=1 Tax=Oryza glumipatula TaxID=40148 RepID=A0A0D9Z7I2_9ORYZ
MPAVLALTAMAMVEAVASEKLSGAGSRRRWRTTAAGADTVAPSPSFHADLSIFLLKLRFGRGRYRRGPRCDDSGKSNPVRGGAPGQAAASGLKWFSAASWIGGEAGSSEARWSGIN